MLHKGNTLKIAHRDYILRGLKATVAAIPASRRQILAQQIRAKAGLLGCKDEEIMKAALGYLEQA